MGRLTFIVLMIHLTTTSCMVGQKKIIYVGDPMCSWCYGIAPELEKLIETYDNQIDFELVTGGLRPYFQTPINEMKDFLKHHWEDVHKASKQPFSYDILDKTDLAYDTEPSCRAVVIVRHMDADKEFEFFKLIQEAFYYHNKDLRAVVSYYPILESLDLDTGVFTERFHSDHYKSLVKKDFQRAADLGVQGFPTILLQSGDQQSVLARGYTTMESLAKLIEKN